MSNKELLYFEKAMATLTVITGINELKVEKYIEIELTNVLIDVNRIDGIEKYKQKEEQKAIQSYYRRR